MVWYGRITRRLIRPPVDTPHIGFQPMGSIVEILELTLVQIHQIAHNALDDGTDAAHTRALQAALSLTSTSLEAVRQDHRLNCTVHAESLHIPHIAPRPLPDVPMRPHGIVIRRQRPPRHRPGIQVDAGVDTVPESTAGPSGPQCPHTPSVLRAHTPYTSSSHHISAHTTPHLPPLTETPIPSEYPVEHVSPMPGPDTYTSAGSGVILPSHPICHDALMTSPQIDVQISPPVAEVTQGHGTSLASTPAGVHRSHQHAMTPLAHLISLVRGRGQGRGLGGRLGGVRGRGGKVRGGQGIGAAKGGDSMPVGDQDSQVIDGEPAQLEDRRPKRLRKKPSRGT